MKRDPNRTRHQTGTAYNSGCRCEVCKETHRNRLNKCRWEREALSDKSRLKHGVRSTYLNWGCRCAPCKETQRVYCNNYQKKRKIIK